MLAAMLIFLVILYWTGYWLLSKGHLPITDRFLVLGGTLLMIIATVVPFLIVMKLIPSTFFLNFLSYEFILLGMMFMVFGIGSLGRYRNPMIAVGDLAEYRKGLHRLKKRSELDLSA